MYNIKCNNNYHSKQVSTVARKHKGLSRFFMQIKSPLSRILNPEEKLFNFDIASHVYACDNKRFKKGEKNIKTLWKTSGNYPTLLWL